MIRKIGEECGVFGIYHPGSNNVVSPTYYALYALQHRGQESCGIAVNDDGVIRCHKDTGLVPDVFNRDTLQKLGEGNIAIGHVRYSTTGNSSRSNAQPLVIKHIKGPLSLCHNGNLVNAHILRNQFEMQGAIFHNTNDTEVIAYAITRARLTSASIEEAIEKAMNDIQGAYCLVLMSAQKLIAARDPEGFRPLCMGETSDGGIVFASETCALDSIGAKFIRDVEPGEIVVVSKDGIRSNRVHCKSPGHVCVFEYVYFARPDSVVDGASVQASRQRAGEFLAKEHPVEADVVIGVPDSGLEAALGYSRESGIPYGIGFIKNRYIGRTFIQPSQGQREDSVRIKLNAVKEAVAGKRVVMIDDSIVRGTTSARIVSLLREAGAKEVHMRVSSPPFLFPCFFGTDIDSKENLIANHLSLEEIRERIGVDSLGYLSIEAVNRIAQTKSRTFCDGCFTGHYPIEVPEQPPKKDKFEIKLSEKQQMKLGGQE